MYEKNWIDTVQWHYEDIIRDPNIDPNEGMKLKRMPCLNLDVNGGRICMHLFNIFSFDDWKC